MKPLLFAINSYGYLADKIMSCTNKFDRGAIDLSHFTDGERYQRIITCIEHRDVILLGGTIDDASTLELYDLASSLVSYGANSLTIIIPYYGYSTMERAVLPGELVTAKTREAAIKHTKIKPRK